MWRLIQKFFGICIFLFVCSAFAKDVRAISFISKNIEIVDQGVEVHKFQNSTKKVLFTKGYFKSHKGLWVYFEYRRPEDYNKKDIIEISGYSKDSAFWKPGNEQGIYFTRAGVLTFDNLGVGKTLRRNFSKPSVVPQTISFNDDAALAFDLIRGLRLSKVAVVGHSRGAAVAAELSRMLLKSDRVQLLSHTDLNGFVCYVSSDILLNSFPERPTGSFFSYRYNKVDDHGSLVKTQINSYSEYATQLLAQWMDFEKEFLNNTNKYSAWFIDKVNTRDDVNPTIREVTDEEYGELYGRYPLLLQGYSEQGFQEWAFVETVSQSAEPQEKKLEFAAMMAQMRTQRTVFSHNGRKYFISHSILPALAEIAKAKVPIIALDATKDALVLKHHFELKKLTLESVEGARINIIKDSDYLESGEWPHYGPLRPVWAEKVVPALKVSVGARDATNCATALKSLK